MLMNEVVADLQIVDLGNSEFVLVFDNLDKSLEPFEEWHPIFSHRGDINTLVAYYTATVEAANPLVPANRLPRRARSIARLDHHSSE